MPDRNATAMQPGPFESALGYLSSLLGDDEPEAAPQTNAMAAARPQKEVAFRASMLPIGNYDDGSVAFPVWPQGAVDVYEALGRFHRGEAPQPEDAVLAGLVMGGAGVGGLGARSAGRAVSGRAPAHVEMPHGLPSHSVEAGSGPVSARVYRGSTAEQTWPHPTRNEFWATDDPAVAGGYARGEAPNIIPADVSFSNPKIVDAGGAMWNRIPGPTGYRTSSDIAGEALRAGHDGLVLRNVIDDAADEIAAPATSYAALQPGTVRSATTGETLFSNPKEAAPAGMLAMDAASRMERARAMGFDVDNPVYHGSNADIAAFEPATIGSKTWLPMGAPRGFYFAKDPQTAARYAKGDGGNITPVFLRNGARVLDNDTIAVVEDPTAIRSINAAFDPAKSDSANILALNPPGAAPAGALSASTDTGEHHSRSQPRGEGGRFVGKDSFDGRIAALDKMLIDLDGDGLPDAVLAPTDPADRGTHGRGIARETLQRIMRPGDNAMAVKALAPAGGWQNKPVPAWAQRSQERGNFMREWFPAIPDDRPPDLINP